jgi:hypothetical protein
VRSALRRQLPVKPPVEPSSHISVAMRGATPQSEASHASPWCTGTTGAQYEGHGARMHSMRWHELPVGQAVPHSWRHSLPEQASVSVNAPGSSQYSRTTTRYVPARLTR